MGYWKLHTRSLEFLEDLLDRTARFLRDSYPAHQSFFDSLPGASYESILQRFPPSNSDAYDACGTYTKVHPGCVMNERLGLGPPFWAEDDEGLMYSGLEGDNEDDDEGDGDEEEGPIVSAVPLDTESLQKWRLDVHGTPPLSEHIIDHQLPASSGRRQRDSSAHHCPACSSETELGRSSS
jgi:hypothetical protein